MNFIIDFTDDATAADIQTYLNDNGCSLLKTFNHFSKVYLVSCEQTPPVTAITQSIIEDDHASMKLLNEVIHMNPYHGISDPSMATVDIYTNEQKDWWKNYVLPNLDFDSEKTSISRKGSGVSVYIMDSGIESSHPEFEDTTIVNLFSFTGSFTDTNGHGTALASLISGKTCGLTDATIKVVKIFDSTTPTRQSDFLAAADAILTDYLTTGSPSVLNCSWAIAKNSYIEDKLRTLIKAGVYVIASAGNSGQPINDVTPASMSEVLTIGSFNSNLEPSDFSDYTGPSVISCTQNETNYGALDGWAPGEQIWLAGLNGQYGFASGTSAAAAIHSAVLAYNLNDAIEFGCTLLTPVAEQNVDWLSKRSLRREGLLNLSGTKYENSVNRISTLSRNVPITVDTMYLPTTYPVTIGQPITFRLINPHTFSQVEILSPLPAGCTITPAGTLVLNPTNAVNGYEMTISPMKLKYYSEETENLEITVAVLAADFNKADYPADDPILQIELQLACNPIGQCADSCPGDGNFCDGSVKAGCACSY